MNLRVPTRLTHPSQIARVQPIRLQIEDARARGHRGIPGADLRDALALDDHDRVPNDVARPVDELPETNCGYFRRRRRGRQQRENQGERREKATTLNGSVRPPERSP